MEAGNGGNKEVKSVKPNNYMLLDLTRSFLMEKFSELLHEQPVFRQVFGII